ncbi:MAG: tetratricopeptide repeat protein, partial [Candidatus Hydrogenedentes bacterium]|nr:tetratricopeptide repeat protein [Candidatus Hydrogenedentota bacterium]
MAKQPGSTRLRECLVALYQQANRPDDAIAMYKELLGLRPNSPQAKAGFAQFLANNQRASEAIPIFEELLRAHPSMYFTLQWQMRQAYEQAGRREDLQKITKEMADRTTNVDQLTQLAEQMLNDRAFDRAVELYQRVLRVDPNRTYLYSQMAQAYRRGGKPDDAIRTYEDYFAKLSQVARQSDLGAAEQYVALGANAGRLEEFKSESSAALGANAGNTVAKTVLAMAAKHEKRYDDAMKLFEELYAAQPNMDIVQQMIKVAEAQEKYDLAIDLIEKRLLPQGSINWDQLAQLYLKKGDRAKACETWKRMADGQNGRWGTTNVLQALVRNKMWDEAIEYYRASVAAVSGDEDLIRNLDHSLIGAARHSKLIADFVEGEVLTRTSPTMDQTIQQYLYQISADPVRMRAILVRMMEEHPENAELLGMYLDHFGETLDADETFRIFTKLAQLESKQPWRLYQCVSRLVDLDRGRDLVTPVTDWMVKHPDMASIQGVVSAITRQGSDFAIDPTTMRDAVLERVPEERRIAARAGFADAMANAGDVPWAHDAMRAAYEAPEVIVNSDQYVNFLMHWGYWDEAIAVPKVSEAIAEGRPTFARIELLLNLGEIDRAEDLAGRILSQGNYENYSLNGFRGYLGVLALARRFEEKLGENAPAQKALELAQVFDEIDDHPHALALTRKVLEREPGNDQAVWQLIERFDHLELKEEKIALLEQLRDRAAKTGGDAVNAAAQLIEAYIAADRKDDARRTLDGVTLDPANPWGAFRLGQLYLQLGDGENALALIEQTAENAPVQDRQRYRVAAMIACGRGDEAMALWREDKSTGYYTDPVVKALTDAGRYADIVEVLRETLA